MTFAQPANLRAVLNLSGDFSSGLDRATGSLGRFEGGLGRVGRGAGQLGAGIARVGAIAATAFVGGVVASVKLAADFESQLNVINTVAQETPEALGAIGDGIRRLARESGDPLEDLTRGYYDLLSAGIAAADAQGILNDSSRLGAGSLGTTSEAVDLLTTALNAYNLSADESARLSNEIAVAVALGKTTLADIAPVYSDVAPLAAIMGIETNELAAAFGAVTAQGFKAADVTTGMRSALRALISPTADLLELQGELGVSFAEIAKEKGLQVALQQMFEAVSGDVDAFNALFGRVEGLNFALAVTGTNAPRFNAALDEVANHVTALDEQVAARRQGLNFQLDILRANLQDVGITIGQALLPELTPLIAQFGEFLAGKAPDIAQFAKDLAGGIREIVAEVKKTDFSGFLGALQIMAQVGGKVVDLFRSLPPDIQALAITGLALNKLSGGLLGAGVGNIARGLIQVVFQRGTTPANPLWVASVGGVGGGVGGGAGGGGGGLGLLGLLSSIVGGAAIGTLAGRELIAPTLQPAIQFEESQFTRLLQAGDPLAQQRALDAINEGIEDIENLGIAKFAFLPELQLLETQRDQLATIISQGQSEHAAEVAVELQAQAADRARGQVLMSSIHGDAIQTAQFLANLNTVEQTQTRREIGAGFAASRTAIEGMSEEERTGRAEGQRLMTLARFDAMQGNQFLSNLNTATRMGTSALTTRLSVLEGLERGGQGILSTHGATLRGILAKPTEVNVNTTVNVSAAGVSTAVNTYTRMRVGGVQADAP